MDDYLCHIIGYVDMKNMEVKMLRFISLLIVLGCILPVHAQPYVRENDQTKDPQYIWTMNFLQSWTENIQNGIMRLNNDPQTIGVTPINGALLLNNNDYSAPGRNGLAISLVRQYNSKFWYADSAERGASAIDHIKAFSWMGMGWDMHFGRYYLSTADDSGLVLEGASGLKTYYRRKSNYSCLATDGSFNLFSHDTLYVSDGTRIVFESTPTTEFYKCYGKTWTNSDTVKVYTVKKIIDADGNYISFFRSNNSQQMGWCSYLYALDSIKTSINQKVNFHYHAQTYPGEYYYVLLDSISYKGYNGETRKIKYHYIYDSTAISVFGKNFVSDIGDPTYDADDYIGYSRPAYLLKSVIYPNNDSVYYDYSATIPGPNRIQ